MVAYLCDDSMKRLVVLFVVAMLVFPQVSPRAFASGTPGIIYSEILANAKNEDTDEFIELYNQSDSALDLQNWVVSDLGDTSDILHEYSGTFKRGATGTLIAPHGFALIVDPEYTGAYTSLLESNTDLSTLIMLTVDDTTLGNGLGNSGDTLTLKNTQGTVVATHSWNKDFGDGISQSALGLANETQAWVGSAHPNGSTPGFFNNLMPTASLSVDIVRGPAPLTVHVDATDSTDPEKQPLVYAIRYGDGESSTSGTSSHTYSATGSYQIELTVTDSEGANNITTQEVIVEETPPILPEPSTPCALRISELLPNPAGDDTEGEFIEIENAGTIPCALAGYSLDDGVEGSSPYSLPHLTIPAGSMHEFFRKETGIALNNSNETARILDSSGHVVESVTFSGSAPEGQSFARDDENVFSWTTITTPGEKNIIQGKAQGATQAPKTDDSPDILTIRDVRKKSLGTKVALEGYVTVVPGKLGTQFFYVQLDNFGVQVFNSKHVFPHIALGDRVRVRGTLSRSHGELRVLTQSVSDVTVIGGRKIVSPAHISAKGLSSSLTGLLVSVVGRVVQKDGTTFYVQDASGKAKVVLDTNTGMNTSMVQKYQMVRITGIATESDAGMRIVPRGPSDVLHDNGSGMLVATGMDIFDPWIFLAALAITTLFLVFENRKQIIRFLKAQAARRFSSSPFRYTSS